MKMFLRPVRDLAEKFNITQNALSSAERIFLVLDEVEGEDRVVHGDKDAANAIGSIRTIEFEDVGFHYVEDEAVLRDVSFSVNAGETVAFVGPTGSGKTTLINLIVRFYEPTSGEIVVNGKDTRALDGLKTALKNEDEIAIFPAVGGG